MKGAKKKFRSSWNGFMWAYYLGTLSNLMRQSLWGYVFPGFCITGIVIQWYRWIDYLFDIWPFATMNICPIAYKIWPSIFKSLPNKFYLVLAKMPKTSNFATLAKGRKILSHCLWTHCHNLRGEWLYTGCSIPGLFFFIFVLSIQLTMNNCPI